MEMYKFPVNFIRKQSFTVVIVRNLLNVEIVHRLHCMHCITYYYKRSLKGDKQHIYKKKGRRNVPSNEPTILWNIQNK